MDLEEALRALDATARHRLIVRTFAAWLTATTRRDADPLPLTKQLALIRAAGHFAAFTRPEQFLHELLTRVRPLALA